MSSAAANYGRSLLTGAAFAISWTPCIGPVLGAILTLAASSSTVLTGAGLLAAWSLGLGLPFILTGLAAGSMIGLLQRIRPAMPLLEFLGGMLVILVGLLVFFDEFTELNRFFTGNVLAVTQSEGQLVGIGLGGFAGFGVAFLAGIIAFLSPCCLPLVPSYIAHLAGVTAERTEMTRRRTETLRHSFVFVGGFSIVFVVLGASVGLVGFLIRDNLLLLQKVAGVILIFMGLNLARIIEVPFLYRSYQLGSSLEERTEVGR